MKKLVAGTAAGLLLVAGIVGSVLLIGHDDGPRPPAGGAEKAKGPAPQPVVRGAKIIDSRDGSEFVPRGVNWSSFEYACTQGWGYSSLDRIGGIAAGVDEAATIASWGVNTVRLPVNQDCWLGTRDAPVSDDTHQRTAAEYQANIATFISDLNNAGMVVILDLQSRKRIGSDDFGNVAMPDEDSLAFWSSAAAAYAGNPSVIFDAFNEPYSRYDPSTGQYALQLTWDCWRDGGCPAPVQDDKTEPLDGQTYVTVGMTAVVDAIRTAGAAQPILLGGLDYANDLTGWLDHAPSDPQLIASVHLYPFKACKAETCWDSSLLPLTDRVPVLVGEVGDDNKNANYVKTAVSWANLHGFGWLAWVWDDAKENPMALVQADRSTPTDPYGIRIKDLLGQG